MANIPIGAKVECADGPCGELVTLIVNPATQTVTHVVVRNEADPDMAQRLVPLEQVVETRPDSIRLRCTKDELIKMEPFTETHFIRKEGPDYSMYAGGEWQQPYATTTADAYTTVVEERIPPGELAIRRGTLVEATDGYVGRVGELVIDPAYGHITHFVLQEGHLWGKKEVTLPLSVIDHVEDRENTVFVKLDKAAIGALPAIPIIRHYGTGAVELVARIFDKPQKAAEALEFLKGLRRQQKGAHEPAIKILNAAVLVKDADGQVSVKETGDLDARQGRLFGAITGGLVGLVAGPAGVVVGALAGAATGRAAAERIDRGLPDSFLKKFQERLQPDTSALLVLVEHEWFNTLSEAMANLEGVVLHQTLTDEMVRQFMGADQTMD
jgi:uncharacterized membrane protein